MMDDDDVVRTFVIRYCPHCLLMLPHRHLDPEVEPETTGS